MKCEYREYQGTWDYEYLITECQTTIKDSSDPEEMLLDLETAILDTTNWSQISGYLNNLGQKIIVRYSQRWSYAIDDGFTETTISRGKAIESLSRFAKELINA